MIRHNFDAYKSHSKLLQRLEVNEFRCINCDSLLIAPAAECIIKMHHLNSPIFLHRQFLLRHPSVLCIRKLVRFRICISKFQLENWTYPTGSWTFQINCQRQWSSFGRVLKVRVESTRWMMGSMPSKTHPSDRLEIREHHREDGFHFVIV